MRIAAAFFALFLFVIISSGGILYTFNQTRVYQAVGTLEIIDPRPVPSLQLDDLLDDTVLPAASAPADERQSGRSSSSSEFETQIKAAEDFATQLEILRSDNIVLRVDQRLQGEKRDRFMAPYLDAAQLSGPLTPAEILRQNRSIERIRLSRIVRVRFTHPDPIIAARVTNLFMEEYINQQLLLEIDGYMKMVEDLRIRIDQLNDRITQLTEANASDTRQQRRIAHLQELQNRLTRAFDEARVRVNIANPEARIIDQALPPPANRPIKPNVPVNLVITFAIACGVSLTCFTLGCILAPRRTPSQAE